MKPAGREREGGLGARAGRGGIRRAGQAGFTLIELMVSAAVMSMILAAAYVCLSSGIASQRLVEGRVDMAQQARVAMGLLAADLRSATPLARDMEFLGMDRMLGEVEADNLDFGTFHYRPQREGEGDFCEVSYFLVQGSEPDQYSLWRRRQPGISPDPLSGGERQEIARGLRGLRFEYYDGLDWYNEWGDPEGRGVEETSLRLRPNLKGMPEAVRMTLWFDPESTRKSAGAGEPGKGGPGLMFQTVARLNLAPLTWATSSGSGSGDGSESTTDEPLQLSPEGGPGQ